MIVSGDHRLRRQIFDRSANRLVHNCYVGTNSNPVEYLDHVRRTHSDTSVACLPAQKRFLRRSVDINAPLKRAFVLLFGSSKPDYSAYDRITSGSVCGQYLAGPLSPVKNRARGCGCTNFCCDLQTTERSLPTSKIISFSVTGRGYLVATIDFTVYDDSQLLIMHTHDQSYLRFGSGRRRGNRRRRWTCCRRRFCCRRVWYRSYKIG